MYTHRLSSGQADKQTNRLTYWLTETYIQWPTDRQTDKRSFRGVVSLWWMNCLWGMHEHTQAVAKQTTQQRRHQPETNKAWHSYTQLSNHSMSKSRMTHSTTSGSVACAHSSTTTDRKVTLWTRPGKAGMIKLYTHRLTKLTGILNPVLHRTALESR